MKKKKRISEIVEGLDEVKKKQILGEIKSVRIQSLIAILSIIGSAIAFLIIQQNNIKSLFEKNPKISFLTDEAFIVAHGLMVATDIKGEIKAQVDIKNLGSGIELNPGNYAFFLKVDSQKIWQQSIALEKNENQKIQLPKFYQGNIHLVVKNNTPSLYKGQKIDVEISSTGNGYLWIYELATDLSVKILFPTLTTMQENEIVAAEPFSFPDNLFLAAGNEVKVEKYVFLVTSINDESYAHEIIDLLFHKNQNMTKGEMKNLEKNWGIQQIQINVLEYQFDKT